MFFDIILLQPQHKSQFGNAWLAATRGENLISKNKLLAIDICKLCDDLREFIISESTSPRKRFSLRLASILINGTIKIFKRQVKMLEVEVLHLFIPSGLSEPLQQRERKSIFESPRTPIAIVKGKKGRKYLKVTSERKLQQIKTVQIEWEERLNLPEVEDVLDILPRSDLFQLRDRGSKQLEEIEEDDFRFKGPLTERELQDFGLDNIFSSSQLPLRPVTSSSSGPIITTDLIETVAQVHKERDASPPCKRLRTESEAQEQERLAEEARPVPRDEPCVQAIPPVEEILPAPVTEENIPAPVTEEILAVPIIEQISEIEHVLKEKNVGAEKKIPRKKPVQQTPKTTKELLKAAYLTHLRRRRRVVKINIDMNEEIETLYNFALDETRCQLDIEFDDLETLFKELWVPRTVTESIQNGSMASLTLGRKSAQKKKGTPKPKSIEKPADQSSSGNIRESSLLSARAPRESPLIMAPGEMSTLIRPRDLSLHTVGPEIEVAREPIEIEGIYEIREQPLVSEVQISQQLQEEMPRMPQMSETEEWVPSVPPELSDIHGCTNRQINIINMVKKCDDQQALRIEDVAEKPIKRLTIARAFSDLLVLTGMKYLKLESEEDSIELKSIKKGPKLLQTE